MKKAFIPLICSLFLVGCGDSTSKKSDEVASPSMIQSAEPEPKKLSETSPTTEAPIPTDSSAALDGAALYGQKCASCHGTKGEKAALGKSQIIAGWSIPQVNEALKGYQKGTYGKEMKSLMQGQAKTLTDPQIDALANHISTL